MEKLGFSQWFEMTAFRDLLKNVPQNPIHHPEISALTHTRLVRKNLNNALATLKSLQANTNSPLHYILQDLDFSLNPEEIKILKMGAWLHDIGKQSATTIDDKHWSEHPPFDPATAHPDHYPKSAGHQDIEFYGPEIAKLPPVWQKLYQANKNVLDFLIQRHMDLYQDNGFSKKIIAPFLHDGKFVNNPNIKLLLILMWADKLGRGGDVGIKGIANNATALVNSVQHRTKEIKHDELRVAADKAKIAAQDTPEKFAVWLAAKNLEPNRKIQAFKGKYPELSDAEIVRYLNNTNI